MSTHEKRTRAPKTAPPHVRSRATMPSRIEPADSLNYAPTPPWATRTLCEVVLPHLGINPRTDLGIVWEPACGEGHMTAVLAEYASKVVGTDIRDYSRRGRSAPGWLRRGDFLSPTWPRPSADWIITNPPFGRYITTPFVAQALDEAAGGVAMFLRSQWIAEGKGRYADIISEQPPTLVAFFVERVPLHMRRWNPKGRTMTAYCWVVWHKGMVPQPPLWIPPGQRERLTHPDDVERFTARPVLGVRG